MRRREATNKPSENRPPARGQSTINKRNNEEQLLPTEAEYQRFAEEFADAALDPRKPWVAQYIMVFGFPPVPTEEDIASGGLAAKIRRAIANYSFLVEEWIHDGLAKPDRQILVDGFKERAKERQLTKDELSRLLACGDSKTVKRSLKGFGEPFKFRTGPAPPTERQYNEALAQAEVLVPALLKLLTQESVGTTHSVRDNLRYLAKDLPKACKFLLENIHRLEQCLEDPNVLAKAKTRPDARARAVADAIAGSVYLNRKFTTALEYLRIERRRRDKSSL
jgi:hypothetical protein